LTWDDICDKQNDSDYMLNIINDSYYQVFRNKTLKHVVNLLNIEFSDLIPGKFIELYNKLTNTDLVIILEALENAWDIAHEKEIGTIRRQGWDYIKYDKSFGISEKEWIAYNIRDVIMKQDNHLLYFDILMFVYWQKRLKVVR
ncbi:MAG TPA: hypothetical protein PKK61_14195, partial [Defluviitaleaceae bacterium]|nr:hypothetical protein [Defluviitaleaceae bacterium]